MKEIIYSIVVPVYNSGKSLVELTQRIESTFTTIVKESFEIIFVDDCSPNPETWKTLKKLPDEYPFVKVYRHSKNFGQGGATICGMSQAVGKWVITMDDDLQQRPEDIPLLLEMKNHDVVIAKFYNKNVSFIKGIGSSFKGFLDRKILGLQRGLSSTSFKLIKKKVANNMLEINTSRPFIIALILNVTSDIVNVNVPHHDRIYGESNYTLVKSIKLLSNLLISNSSILLRLMNIIGISISFLSLLFGLFLIGYKLLNPDILTGWTSLMIMLLFSLGVILFSLGILGEYIYRLEEGNKKLPRYIVKESIVNENIINE
jgi:glycosyltransferase involved in cell wall biosynthesis